jgi:hypothetical protein
LAYGADKQIVTVTGATGLNLSLSTQTVTYDSWLLANVINSPPPPVLIGSVSEATDFFLIFSYPIQYQFGLMNTLIPCISNAVLTIGGNNTILSKQNTFVYNYTKTNLSDNIIQCLHFYKGTSTYISKNKYTYNGVDYYMDHYAAPDSSSIEFYYTNHSSSPVNKLPFTVSYLPSGKPTSKSGNDIILSLTSVTGGRTSSVYTITMSSDEYYNDYANKYIITSYPLTDVITYKTKGDNSIRYQGKYEIVNKSITLTTILTLSLFTQLINHLL